MRGLWSHRWWTVKLSRPACKTVTAVESIDLVKTIRGQRPPRVYILPLVGYIGTRLSYLSYFTYTSPAS